MLQNPTQEVHRGRDADPTPPWIAVAVFWPAAGVSSGVLIALGRDARLPVASGVMVATIVANLMGDRNVWNATPGRINTGTKITGETTTTQQNVGTSLIWRSAART
jgi:hypothetical protein